MANMTPDLAAKETRVMEPIRYYQLGRLITVAPPAAGEFRIATAAILSCGLCGTVIDGMGGPGDGAVCQRCGDLLKRGGCVGAVKWE